MKIPVFVAAPTALSKAQDAQRNIVCAMLDELNLAPRALGRSDYPADLPLRVVLVIARHCAGGVILGFNQFTATAGKLKPGLQAAGAIGVHGMVVSAIGDAAISFYQQHGFRASVIEPVPLMITVTERTRMLSAGP